MVIIPDIVNTLVAPPYNMSTLVATPDIVCTLITPDIMSTMVNSSDI